MLGADNYRQLPPLDQGLGKKRWVSTRGALGFSAYTIPGTSLSRMESISSAWG